MVFKRIKNYISWLYMQYLLNTALYMLEPFEVRVFNFLALFLLVFIFYSAYIFLLPQLFVLIN
jgi:hypothetical protein